jgi:hypothetical protein
MRILQPLEEFGSRHVFVTFALMQLPRGNVKSYVRYIRLTKNFFHTPYKQPIRLDQMGDEFLYVPFFWRRFVTQDRIVNTFDNVGN